MSIKVTLNQRGCEPESKAASISARKWLMKTLFAVFVIAAHAAHSQSDVGFSVEPGRVAQITVNGIPILGEPNTGGIYLIGSVDGSDVKGRSVTSRQPNGNYMRADANAPKNVPFTTSFWKIAPGRYGFSASVGPVPQQFATMSMPFDFIKDQMTHFTFNGSRYWLESTFDDGLRIGSSADYDSIHPKGEIRDSAGKLLGLVGVANTRIPATWGEVTGPNATVRVNIYKSSHYARMGFLNHFGTNNLELGFGAMRRGETAKVEGEIVVTARPLPTSWLFETEQSPYHQVGRVNGRSWSVRAGDPSNRFLNYGPYFNGLGSGLRTASFRISTSDEKRSGSKVLNIDVFDATTGNVIKEMAIKHKDFAKANVYQTFSLQFQAEGGHRYEFRTYYFGGNINQDCVTVTR